MTVPLSSPEPIFSTDASSIARPLEWFMPRRFLKMFRDAVEMSKRQCACSTFFSVIETYCIVSHFQAIDNKQVVEVELNNKFLLFV